MKQTLASTAVAACLLAVLSAPLARAQQPPTADQGKNDAADRLLMQKIRKSIVGDKSLSTDAHNVKIISQAGKVTLRGQVRSDEEKRTVVDRATDAAGSGNVVDELTVKPKKNS